MKRFVYVLTFVALTIGMGGLAAGATESNTQLTKTQVKNLILTASTPEDHMKLAQYYQTEAKKLGAEAREHEEMAADYFKDPIHHPVPKYPTLGQHCRDLASYYVKAAQRAGEMAAMHEEMAKQPAK